MERLISLAGVESLTLNPRPLLANMCVLENTGVYCTIRARNLTGSGGR